MSRTTEFPLDDSQLRDINASEHKSMHRICVSVDRPLPVLASKLRHELEHARQWELGGGQALFEFAECVYEVGSVRFGGLPQSGRVYNAMPQERDANAAGSRFARRRFSSEVIEDQLLGPDSVLFRYTDEPRPESVGLRMVLFAAIWPQTLEGVVADRGQDLERLLRSVDRAGISLWQGLAADADFAALRQLVSQHEPTDASLSGLDEREIARGWTGLLSVVQGAFNYACSKAGVAG